MANSTGSTVRKLGLQAVVQELPRGKDLNVFLLLSRSRS
jgi:hypothetical protein